MDIMDYGIEMQGADVVVQLRGRLTFNDHAQFRNLIQTMLSNKHKRHVIDLSHLDFVDSAGLGMLLIAREEMGNQNGLVILRGPQGQVKRVLSVARLAQIMTIEE
jgi:HptB-dependent secretion and biofilm anti anti-sigma factor